MRPREKNKHLPRCVYLRHGAYWYVKGGKWIRLGSNLSVALAEYARLIETPRGSMPELIWKVLGEVKPRLAANTVTQYTITARKLAKILAEFRPEDVKPKHVARIKVQLSDTPNMANRCLSFLRVVFQHALEWQLVDSNPCIGVKRCVERKRGRYLTDDELAAIRAKAGPRLKVIIDLAYGTGQRISDVLGIRRADLTDAGIEFVQRKTGTKLTVGWSAGLRRAVDDARRLYGNLRAFTLLHNRRGKAPDYRTVRDQWTKACKAARVRDAHLHDLRAKSLTDTKRQGNDAQALAGHASPAMTARYIRLRESPVVSGPSFGQLGDTV